MHRSSSPSPPSSYQSFPPPSLASSMSSSSPDAPSSLKEEYETLKASMQCPKCQDTFQKPVKILPCLHSFCFRCINLSSSSSSSSSSCPLCLLEFSFSPASKHPGARDDLVIHENLDRLGSLSSLLEFNPSLPPPPPAFVEISPLSQKERLKATFLVEEAQTRRQDIEASLSLVQQMEEKIQESSVSQKALIFFSLEDLKQKIEQKQEALIKELDERSKVKLDKLGEQRRELERNLQAFDNSLSVSRNVLRNANDVQFDSQFPLIEEQLKRIKEEKSYSQTPVETRHIEILIDKPVDLTYILNQGFQLVEEETEEVLEALNQVDGKPQGENNEIIGTHGKLDGQFSHPGSVAVDSQNRVAVCDEANHRIQLFDEQRKHIKTFGGQGKKDGQFVGPRAIAVDHHNRIIVCDRVNSRVQIFDDQGNHVKSFGSFGKKNGQFMGLGAIAVDRHNRIIVAEKLNHRVQIFDDQGNHLKTLGSVGKRDGQFLSPGAVVVDHRDRIIVVDRGNDRLQIFG